MNDIVAVIPAAGLGTRFLPFTRTVSKELLPILNKPTLHYIFEELVAAGITKVVMVTREGKEDLQRCCDVRKSAYDELLSQDVPALNEWRDLVSQLSISWVYQKFPNGLGHAILSAEKEVAGKWILVALPDVIMDCKVSCSKQLIDAHRASGKAVIASHAETQHPLSNYGVLDIASRSDSRIIIKRIVEKPAAGVAPSQWIASGRYLMPPTLFSVLKTIAPGSLGEIQLTDALNVLLGQGLLEGLAFEGLTLDTGNVAGWLDTNLHFARLNNPS